MAYKHVLYCPEDKTKLDTMVSSANGEETYHCIECDTYWHFKWMKQTPLGGGPYKWRLVYIRDDFGKTFAVNYDK